VLLFILRAGIRSRLIPMMATHHSVVILMVDTRSVAILMVDTRSVVVISTEATRSALILGAQLHPALRNSKRFASVGNSTCPPCLILLVPTVTRVRLDFQDLLELKELPLLLPSLKLNTSRFLALPVRLEPQARTATQACAVLTEDPVMMDAQVDLVKTVYQVDAALLVPQAPMEIPVRMVIPATLAVLVDPVFVVTMAVLEDQVQMVPTVCPEVMVSLDLLAPVDNLDKQAHPAEEQVRLVPLDNLVDQEKMDFRVNLAHKDPPDLKAKLAAQDSVDHQVNLDSHRFRLDKEVPLELPVNPEDLDKTDSQAGPVLGVHPVKMDKTVAPVAQDRTVKTAHQAVLAEMAAWDHLDRMDFPVPLAPLDVPAMTGALAVLVEMEDREDLVRKDLRVDLETMERQVLVELIRAHQVTVDHPAATEVLVLLAKTDSPVALDIPDLKDLRVHEADQEVPAFPVSPADLGQLDNQASLVPQAKARVIHLAEAVMAAVAVVAATSSKDFRLGNRQLLHSKAHLAIKLLPNFYDVSLALLSYFSLQFVRFQTKRSLKCPFSDITYT